MDSTIRKIKKYGNVVREWLAEFVSHRTNAPDATYELIADDVRHHYQVVRTGWLDGRFYHKVVFHLHIKDNAKVWILVNNTDLLLTDDLMASGVLTSDIVIGFLPEDVRAFQGFAAA
jgi:XisI protein